MSRQPVAKRSDAGNGQVAVAERVATRLPAKADALNGSSELRIELWEISRVIPYARNARKIPPSAVAKVAASLREFGWRQPIVVDSEGVIVCGHARLLAAQQLEMPRVPVHVAHDLTPAQIKAYRLMDNRSHLEAQWDETMLAVEVSELKGVVDLALTGFDATEIRVFLGEEPMPEPGDAPIENANVAFGVVIDCRDEAEQVGFLTEFAQRGIRCRALM